MINACIYCNVEENTIFVQLFIKTIVNKLIIHKIINILGYLHVIQNTLINITIMR